MSFKLCNMYEMSGQMLIYTRSENKNVLNKILSGIFKHAGLMCLGEYMYGTCDDKLFKKTLQIEIKLNNWKSLNRLFNLVIEFRK